MSADNRDRLMLALVLLVLKGTLLVMFGPAILPDTGSYTGFADLILADRLAQADLDRSAVPMTLFRVIGYPAVVAAAKLVQPVHWPWLLVVVQITLSVAASLGVHAIARRFGLNRVLAALAVLAAATSLSLVLDQSILTDSLYTSLMLGCTCLLSLPLLAGRPVSVVLAVLAGLLFAAAFLVREATLFLSVGVIPLVGLAALGAQRPTLRRAARMVAVIVIFLLPILVTQQIYREWNRARIGAPIITTGAQTNTFLAVATAARIDPSVLAGDDVVNRTARQVFHTYEFYEVMILQDVLFREHGMNAVMLTQAGFQHYFAAWRDHFPAMLRMALDHFRSNQTQMTVRPVDSLRELILWTRHDDGGFGRWRSVREGRWWMAPLVVLDGLGKAVSMVVFAAFAVLTPWRLLRGDGYTPATAAAAGLWLLYFALFGIYALIHLETRYMAAVVPASLVVGLANLQWLRQQWKCRRRAQTNGL